MDKSPEPRPGITKREAAADEMYEALRGIESTYVFLESLTAGSEPQHSNTVKALAAIRAALAKADGAQ